MSVYRFNTPPLLGEDWLLRQKSDIVERHARFMQRCWPLQLVLSAAIVLLPLLGVFGLMPSMTLGGLMSLVGGSTLILWSYKNHKDATVERKLAALDQQLGHTS